MTDKLSLANIASLQNETTAIAEINANNAIIVAAFDNTLSRDGTSPNQMGASLDMNSNRILNLPAPTNPTDPVRLQDVPAANTSTPTFSYLNVIAANAVVNSGGYANTGTLATFLQGSPANPITTASPSILISKYQYRTDDAEGAQDTPLMIYNVCNGYGGSYNTVPQVNGLMSWAKQIGHGDSVGVWGQAQQSGTGYRFQYPASLAANGQIYEISVSGNTNWVAIGAANNNVGTIFTASGAGTGTGFFYLAPINATAMIAGWAYQIKTVGTTTFTSYGAPDNNVGTQFRASGAATGSGTVYQLQTHVSWGVYSNSIADPGSLGGIASFATNTDNNSGYDGTWSAFVSGANIWTGLDIASVGTNAVASGVDLRCTASFNKFDVGFGAVGDCIRSYFLRDDTNSNTVLSATGTHTYGIDLTGATITTYAIKTTGFTLGNGGDVLLSGSTSNPLVIRPAAANIPILDTIGNNLPALWAYYGNGSLKWYAGKQTDDSFIIYDYVASKYILQSFSNSNVVTLGHAATNAVSLAFANATSGTVSLTPATGALGSSVLTLPAKTGTVATLGDGISNIFKVNIDLNTLGDNAIALPTLPSGYTKWQVWQLVNANSGSVASLTTAQYGLFTAASGGGIALVAGGTALSGLTSNAANTVGNMQVVAGVQTVCLDSTITNLYYRVTQVQSAGATVNATIFIRPLP